MDIDAVHPIDINKEMRSAYLDYAMSVIVRRALPDARDGLKPVHRRILYAMNDLGMRSNSPFKKSARIVGEVLGKYHPHGDSAVYESMARMAQDFSLRYMLIDGQGNFGSIHGDSPAAMRYTEARLHRMAEEMLVDINQDTVDFGENFDGSLEEPQVLPARLPNLLLNGTSGIAVGMATNIPPHNLNELADGLKFMLDNYDTMDDIAMEDLLTYIKGPDFPTGGAIIGTEGIRQAYSSGRGRIIVRGTAEIEERNGRFRIVISEVPYQTNLTSLIERIAELVRSGRLSDISDLRDESDRDGLSIVIELKKWAQPKMVLNSLYKYTGMQTTFGVQLLALVNGEPRLLSLKRALQHYLEHRIDVITRRTRFQLEKARARLHILDGLVIALANLDAVIAVIRKSPDADQAKTRLMDSFGLSELQAQAILDMQLRRLAALEQQKIEAEHREVSDTIADLLDLLANKSRVLTIIREDLDDVTEKYGDRRRTQILVGASGDLNEEDLIKDESIIISLTERGYVKRVPAKTFRAQGRGGRGVKGHTTREKDEILLTIPTRTHHTVLYFSDKGKVYSEKAYQVPDASRQARGIPIINILNLDPTEVITAAVAVPDFDDAQYCTMMTRKGRTKRVSLSSFSSVRASGLIAITIRDGDELGWVRLTSGEDHIIVVTKNGRGLRFKESDIREMGRTAAGVIGIRMRGDDEVTSMEVVEPNGELLVVTTGGYGKRTPLEEYIPKSRGSLGVQTINKYMIPQIGKIAAARVVQLEDHLAIMSTNGVIIRTVVEEISQSGRATKGVIVMNLNEGDSVAAVARILAADLVVTDDDNNIEEEETFARSSSTPQEEDQEENIEADVPEEFEDFEDEEDEEIEEDEE